VCPASPEAACPRSAVAEPARLGGLERCWVPRHTSTQRCTVKRQAYSPSAHVAPRHWQATLNAYAARRSRPTIRPLDPPGQEASAEAPTRAATRVKGRRLDFNGQTRADGALLARVLRGCRPIWGTRWLPNPLCGAPRPRPRGAVASRLHVRTGPRALFNGWRCASVPGRRRPSRLIFTFVP